MLKRPGGESPSGLFKWGDYGALFDDDTEWMPYGPGIDWECNQLFMAITSSGTFIHTKAVRTKTDVSR